MIDQKDFKLDPILEKIYNKFDINSEIKNETEKYLSKELRWEIVTEYYKSIKLDCNINMNKENRTLLFTFKNNNDAKKFADKPSKELQKYARQYLISKGEDPKKYDLYFNLTIVYDDNKKPLVVFIRVL